MGKPWSAWVFVTPFVGNVEEILQVIQRDSRQGMVWEAMQTFRQEWNKPWVRMWQEVRQVDLKEMTGIRSVGIDDLKLHLLPTLCFGDTILQERRHRVEERRRKWVQVLICFVDWVQNVNYIGEGEGINLIFSGTFSSVCSAGDFGVVYLSWLTQHLLRFHNSKHHGQVGNSNNLWQVNVK